MSIANWNAGIIRPVAVAPTGPFQNGAAPGVWTLDQAAYWTKQGVWPTAGLSPNYIESVFSTFLYTGNGSTQTITNGIDLAGKGGLVWFKPRNTANNHNLIDSARGLNKFLITNDTAAQGTTGVGYGVSSFNSDGFSLASPWTSSTNTTDTTYASWTFRKQPKFFDVVTYTGNGAVRNIAHSLGSVPGMIIIKDLNVGFNWSVYHRSIPNTDFLQLNLTSAKFTNADYWNSTTPTSSDFTLGTNGTVNGSGTNYVAYLFAHDAGGFGLSGNENVVSCGSYTTDGSGNATVNLGYEPQWLLRKRSDAASDWIIVDNMRGWATGNTNTLAANTADQEFGGGFANQITSTGFSVTSDGASRGYIYIAIRRGPMKVPTLGTTVFTPLTRTGTGAAATVTGIGFAPDMLISENRNSAEGWMANRLAGFSNTAAKYLFTPYTSAESSVTSATSGVMLDGTTTGTVSLTAGSNLNSSGQSYVDWFFQRAPGYMDVVCWTANGAAQNISHNLTVAPELMIFKGRSVANNWYVGANFTSTTYMGLYLDATNTGTTGAYDNAINAQPTATVFRPGSNLVTSGNTVVTYLFATCPGVSKVGSYTGTGTTQAINCGFTTGARFVLIKRTDSTGAWYVWDSARGIVAGNDPYLLLNSTAAEVTSTDYVDTSATGFELTSTAPAAINASGGSYIFLAVA